ncbi:MAG: RNA 3'-terminal phosphate cyclase, partial [Desulfuromonadales bacterium]|nr:RNA 3'-terminal phosphate cyclase [Desulfuromonadales bacterium]
LTFVPRQIRAGRHRFAVGSAGSGTLVLQTVLPPLLTADSPSELLLEGGTHNPFAPPFDFLERSFLPLVERMGPCIEAILEQPGFYPAGGGRLRVRIDPAPRLTPLELLARGDIVSQRATAMVAQLPRQIAERELRTVADRLGWGKECLEVREISPAPGPGNVLLIEVASEQVTEVFTGFGERGVRAERVAERAAAEALEYLAADVPVGRHLADQLLLPLALAGGGAFRTLRPTRHTMTNIEVIRDFLPVAVEVREEAGGTWQVRIGS